MYDKHQARPAEAIPRPDEAAELERRRASAVRAHRQTLVASASVSPEPEVGAAETRESEASMALLAAVPDTIYVRLDRLVDDVRGADSLTAATLNRILEQDYGVTGISPERWTLKGKQAGGPSGDASENGPTRAGEHLAELDMGRDMAPRQLQVVVL